MSSDPTPTPRIADPVAHPAPTAPEITTPIVPPQTPQDIELADVHPTEEHPVIAAPTIARIDDAPTAGPPINLAHSAVER